jgi:hypothetical protein
MTDTACEIAFTEQGKDCGRSRFTIEDARKAQTKNLDKFPRNMLFARAMSNGCRWYCPDVFNGAPTYTPEELGANINESGDVIDIPVYQAPKQQAQPTEQTAQFVDAPAAPVIPADVQAAMDRKNSAGTRYGDIETATLANMVNAMVQADRKPETTDEQRAEHAAKTADARKIMAWRAQK